jgi:3-hydroxyacyl-[acyl-carrier-protein] dehydratase
MNLPCATGDLISQTGKMGFNQTLTNVNTGEGQSTAVVGAEQIFLNDVHRLANPALIEYINQLVAAVHGYTGSVTGKPVKKGLFVGLQDALFYHDVFLGDQLTLKAHVTEEIAPVSFVKGMIERDGDRIAEFVTKLYEIEDPEELNRLTKQGSLGAHYAGALTQEQRPPANLTSDLRRKLFLYLQDIEADQDLITFRIVCPDNFDAFDGHFPGNPLLPGIVLLEIGQLAVELLLGESVCLKSIQKMKIGGVVLPNQVISCMVKIEGKMDLEWAFSAILKGGNGKEISRYNGTCVKEESNGESKNR